MLFAGPVPRGYDDMTREQLNREILYHASLAPFRRLLSEGHISRSDYDKIDTILAQKYRPIFVNIMPQN